MLKLHPFQVEGVAFLRRRHTALLGDEMGLGKTPQAIRALDSLYYDFPSKKDPLALIICPAIARLNWKREFKKFGNGKRKIHVVQASVDLTKWDRKSHLITSYGLAASFLRFLQRRTPHGPVSIFSVVILDEIHYLKNKKAQRTKNILGKKGIVRYAKRTWGLSGTLMPNHAGELWTILFTLGATKLSYYSFIKKFCNYYGGYSKGGYAPLIITGTKRESIPELRKLLAPILLRRLSKEVLDLPPMRFGEIIVTPPKELEEDLLNDVDMQTIEDQLSFLKREDITLEKLGMLSSSISTLRRFTGLQKVSAIATLVAEELKDKAYNKIVLFCIHKGVAAGLAKRLWEFKPGVIVGETPTKQRETILDRFQNGDGKLLMANILTAGTAINLTACSQEIFVELDWVPGNNAQAAKRCHRIGQRRSVYVRIASLVSSLDLKINEILRKKVEEICLTFN